MVLGLVYILHVVDISSLSPLEGHCNMWEVKSVSTRNQEWVWKNFSRKMVLGTTSCFSIFTKKQSKFAIVTTAFGEQFFNHEIIYWEQLLPALNAKLRIDLIYYLSYMRLSNKWFWFNRKLFIERHLCFLGDTFSCSDWRSALTIRYSIFCSKKYWYRML